MTDQRYIKNHAAGYTRVSLSILLRLGRRLVCRGYNTKGRKIVSSLCDLSEYIFPVCTSALTLGENGSE
jgi:hypothetical protein